MSSAGLHRTADERIRTAGRGAAASRAMDRGRARSSVTALDRWLLRQLAFVLGKPPVAFALLRAGLSVAVLDREAFPRTKLCAGWITPEVLQALELDPRDYPHGLVTFDRLVVHQEFEHDWQDGRCHLWFFDHGLPGYAWYVPTPDGWLNCGIGALAAPLKRRGENLRRKFFTPPNIRG